MMAGAMNSITSYFKGSSTIFNVNGNCQHFQDLVINNKLDDEVAAAIDYVSNNVDVAPAGKSTGLMATDMLATHKQNGSSPLFSGSLTMLDLKDTATSTSDTARMKWFLEEAMDHNSLRKAVGPIGVNGDRWAGEMAKFSAWHRCDKDAEVVGL